MEVVIGADGRVKSVRFVESSHPGYDYHVRLATNAWRYVPASRDSIAVESVRVVVVEIPAR
jgi:hypothetical protein